MKSNVSQLVWSTPWYWRLHTLATYEAAKSREHKSASFPDAFNESAGNGGRGNWDGSKIGAFLKW